MIQIDFGSLIKKKQLGLHNTLFQHSHRNVCAIFTLQSVQCQVKQINSVTLCYNYYAPSYKRKMQTVLIFHV